MVFVWGLCCDMCVEYVWGVCGVYGECVRGGCVCDVVCVWFVFVVCVGVVCLVCVCGVC